MKTLIFAIFATWCFGCSKSEHMDSAGTIVAYTSSKHSKVWILEDNTKRVEPVKTGKFREPRYGVGSRIDLKYRVRRNNSIDISINQDKYIIDAAQWLNYSRCLRGYENLIQ